MDVGKIKRLTTNEKIFTASNPKIVVASRYAFEQCCFFNQLVLTKNSYDFSILRQLFNDVGVDTYIEPNFMCTFGFNISVGNNFFANHDVTMFDFAPITIGSNVNVAPKVGFYTANYLEEPLARKAKKMVAKPITLEDGVWVGGSAIILGGVTVGANSIIGAGSVVTHDIPANVVAVGNPAKILRPIKLDD
ncbi:sugar O-acetyltransferase [Liquorilactobacillus mali]|uniref:Acetyltransferase n=1 Tax=Liquorilactobacillus mali KCTC 3596 = DSM 20444 TaxID=1046596 RepID=J1F156_9LACO|nr:sugar O-acetyltransferase [Liquorilactobacillus mali]EJE97972.1 Acetyltransferase [Liquorilactobacillus mali KCTC 3596 = DSM 20444]KRN09169.1 acetyltransferase [Liquorilactobacillus mali KCTC 3596 = DSM 20444]QFQ73675.1 sugar O-acetyltransferase [Liquorilactobacillus mali]